MNKEEKHQYWLEYAKRDLETAEALFSTGKWFYVVFMCQQAIEKLVKGLYNYYVDDNVPRSHNIQSIYDRTSDKLPEKISDKNYNLLGILTSYYVGNRYPDFISRIGSDVDKTMANNILIDSKELFVWLTALKK
jgi:HEPN domain-containing protein